MEERENDKRKAEVRERETNTRRKFEGRKYERQRKEKKKRRKEIRKYRAKFSVKEKCCKPNRLSRHDKKKEKKKESANGMAKNLMRFSLTYAFLFVHVSKKKEKNAVIFFLL